jgi:hypothetical protein
MNEIRDTFKIKGTVTVDKFDAETMELKESKTFENTTLLGGYTEILKLITGASTNVFNGTYATIGVGSDTTAAAEAQTDLLAATNKTYKAMMSGYPTAPSSQTIQFKASFLPSEANYAWQEYVIKHSSSAICIARGVSSLGTKTNAEVWNITWTWGK